MQTNFPLSSFIFLYIKQSKELPRINITIVYYLKNTIACVRFIVKFVFVVVLGVQNVLSVECLL